MGFFRSLLRFILNGEISVNVHKNIERPRSKERDIYSEASRETSVRPAQKSRDTIKSVVDDLCRDRFYTSKDNVDITTFGDQYESKYQYTHIIRDGNGSILAAIFVVPHNGERNRHYYQLKQACIDNDVPFVYFFEEMSNTRSYVEERIKSVL